MVSDYNFSILTLTMKDTEKMRRASEQRKSILFMAQSAHDINIYKRKLLSTLTMILV
jgi:hypothetical protein